MSIPKYAFQVRVTFNTRNIETKHLYQEQHNYENIVGANGYMQIMVRKPSVRRVQLLMIIDEWSRSGDDDGS